jgi:hypothetical protein
MRTLPVGVSTRIRLVRLIGFWVTGRNFGNCNASDNMRFVDTLTGVIRIAYSFCLYILGSLNRLMGEWGATGCLANDSETFYRC